MVRIIQERDDGLGKSVSIAIVHKIELGVEDGLAEP